MEGVAPDLIHQLLARECATGVAGQEQQQLELALLEGHLLAADARPSGGGLDHEVRELQRRLVISRSVHPAQHGVDAGDELSRLERFDDIVVRAEAEPDHTIGLLAPRGQQDHGDAVAVQSIRADATHHLEAVETREHQAQHDQVGTAGADRSDGGRPIGRCSRVVPGAAQVACNHLGDRRLVVDDQNGPATVRLG